MKKLFSTFFIAAFCFNLQAHNFELNTSYDYFRGLPDGSWNGNSGLFAAGNLGIDCYKYLGIQIGGSFGFYNWDGRDNLAFRNPKALQEQAFVTAGLFSSFCHLNVGLVYDRLFARHMSIFAVNTTFDQMRFQLGYSFCSEEIGVWGTSHIVTATEEVLGIPISFKAISQLNVFWTHHFQNRACTTIWLGAPYRTSLFYPNRTAGIITTGFSLRAPLTNRLFIDAHGSYMRARNLPGSLQSRNYDAAICVGITYSFGGFKPCCRATYMPIANNSNFLIDTNINN